MRNATVVKLGGNPQGTLTVATFEEAFGGENFSEARGKGRERRAARKADKTAKKTTRKTDRIAGKDTVKRARRESKIARKDDRKSLRQTNRQERRTEKKGMRQERRTGNMQARQERKYGRKDMRLQRKDLGRDTELEMDEQSIDQTEAGYQDQGGYDQQDQGGGYSDEQGVGSADDQGYGNGEGEYQATQDSDYQEGDGYEEDGYEEEGYDDEGYGDEGYGEEDGYEEEGYDDDYGIEQTDNEDESYNENGDDYSFDGVMGAEDRFSEASDSAKPVVNVDPNIQTLAQKVEWNKEMVSRLRIKKAVAMGRNADTTDIQNEINSHLLRITDLQKMLRNYVNFEGEYSSADGRKARKPMKQRRAREVRKANRIACAEYDKIRKGNASAKKVRMSQLSAKGNRNGGDATPVEAELDPTFSVQTIVIPGKSNFTGLNGIDLKEDYDAPDTRIVELGSNATGPGSGPRAAINWRAVGIGVGIAVAVIVGYKMYKKYKK